MNLPLRFALRELRGGLTGLRLLGVCLILGVAALAGVGSLASAITQGLHDRGQLILGGDVEARLTGRFASPDELARFDAVGDVAQVVRLRAMAGRVGGEDRILSELKAVDPAWPLYGRFEIAGGGNRLSPGSVAIAPALAERLKVGKGDRLAIGTAEFTIAGVVESEPDKAGEGMGFGPGVLMPLADLERTGLIAPGSMFRSHYRILLPVGADPVAVVDALQKAAPDAGFQFQDRNNGAPGTRQFVDRLGQFLTLVGLTALVVAGVGVGGGVGAYLGHKTRTIATLKTLGADSATIRATYLWQIGLVALGAVTIGLIIGAATPWLVVQFMADTLPVPPSLSPQWAALATSAAYGLLIALAFALWPLAQAARMPAARLFRSITERRDRPGLGTIAIMAAAGLAIVGLTVLNATDRMFVLAFIGAALALIALL
ncbi:MAG: ABC transporter permease, partial [Sandarakinorhabdus sp.]|nr:ABC transporter permease [Sandarakinorhabdus sp.]